MTNLDRVQRMKVRVEDEIQTTLHHLCELTLIHKHDFKKEHYSQLFEYAKDLMSECYHNQALQWVIDYWDGDDE